MNIAVLGSGNGGCAVAFDCAANGHQVRLFDFEQFPEEILKQISFHACIAVTGKLVESQGAGQDVEVLAETLEILGEANPDVAAGRVRPPQGRGRGRR